jgi:hypothetical protein
MCLWRFSPKRFRLRSATGFRLFGRRRQGRSAPRRDRGTFLYVLQGQHGLSKIGVSKNPNARLRQLRTASAFPINFAFVAATPGTGFDIERKAHAALAAHRRHGEWFDVSANTAVAAVHGAAHRLRQPLRPIRAGAIGKLEGPAWPNAAAPLAAAGHFLVRALVALFGEFAGALLAVVILLTFINMEGRKADRAHSVVAMQRAHLAPPAHPRRSGGPAALRPEHLISR